MYIGVPLFRETTIYVYNVHIDIAKYRRFHEGSQGMVLGARLLPKLSMELEKQLILTTAFSEWSS